jgi:hypothetical protein
LGLPNFSLCTAEVGRTASGKASFGPGNDCPKENLHYPNIVPHKEQASKQTKQLPAVWASTCKIAKAAREKCQAAQES